MDKSQPSYGGYPAQPAQIYPNIQPAENYPYPKPGQPSTLPVFVGGPEQPYSPPKYGWFEDTQRNKPQSNTLAAATFIFASGGMSLAWSVGFAPYYRFISEGTRTHMQICWFVGIIIGAIIAAILANKLQKRIFNLLASILVLVNGILFVADSQSVAAAISARYCDGIAFGLTIIPAIMAGSEQSVKRFRGLVLSIESIGITMGISLKTVYSTFWGNYWDFNANQMHGALALVFGVIALLFTFIFTIESPTFYLRRGQESQALDCLRRLQRPKIVTTETYALLAENKHLLEEDEARGTAENITLGLMPMAKLSFFRALVSMSFSLPLTMAYVVASSIVVRSDPLWPIYCYGTLRMLGTLFAVLFLDVFGRRIPTGISLLICGGLAIGVGSIFSSNYIISTAQMGTVMGLLMGYQLFAGYVAPASTTYLGEAFSISVKPYYILVAVICENIVQIIICCTFESKKPSYSSFAYALGSLQIVFALLTFVAMPETKNKTLREALAKFKKVLNVNIG